MIKCFECGAEFHAAKTEYAYYDPSEREKTGYTYEVCPECGSDHILDGEECPQCGAWSEDGICEDCRKKLAEKLGVFRKELTVNELRALDRMLDGKWFSDFLEEVCAG